jgi:hypothetical protein
VPYFKGQECVANAFYEIYISPQNGRIRCNFKMKENYFYNFIIISIQIPRSLKAKEKKKHSKFPLVLRNSFFLPVLAVNKKGNNLMSRNLRSSLGSPPACSPSENVLCTSGWVPIVTHHGHSHLVLCGLWPSSLQ